MMKTLMKNIGGLSFWNNYFINLTNFYKSLLSPISKKPVKPTNQPMYQGTQSNKQMSKQKKQIKNKQILTSLK